MIQKQRMIIQLLEATIKNRKEEIKNLELFKKNCKNNKIFKIRLKFLVDLQKYDKRELKLIKRLFTKTTKK